jgi:hypothetical protein
MSRIVRLSLTLLFALMMVIATVSGALAFDPPDHNDASTLCGFDHPSITKGPFIVDTHGHPTNPNGGPWNAVTVGPFTGPLAFDDCG